MINEIICMKFLGITNGLNYNVNPQYAGDVEAKVILDDGREIEAVLFVDWCPSAHAPYAILNASKNTQEVLKALDDSLSPMQGDFMRVKFKKISI